MSKFEIQMPKLGESVQEATITKWFVKEGDTIAEDGVLFEVATDKVDSEIPSPVDGIITKILYKENDVVPVGQIIAEISLNDEAADSAEMGGGTTESEITADESHEHMSVGLDKSQPEMAPASNGKAGTSHMGVKQHTSGRFYSPLVRTIAQKENVSVEELEKITGSGQNGRVQKNDLLSYLAARKQPAEIPVSNKAETLPFATETRPAVNAGEDSQVIEMDRVRKLIATHMVHSKNVAPHVTSVVEADVTNLVLWRQKAKDEYLKKYGEKLTFMPVFIEAAAKALTEYPWVNASVDGDKIYLHKNVNIGIAVAKPDGNLVVPVIQGANQKNLLGLAKSLNRLAAGARANKLTPDDYVNGTFSITNFGSFRNIIGTPIINQPQVAILATGSIEKKPAVMETPTGDVIAIRHKMYLSLSYDHRIIDGALGGAFLRRIADILESFDLTRDI